MTTSSAAKAGHSGEREKEKEKAGIRRALGRGLESLLPGPRRVADTELRVPSGESESNVGAVVRDSPQISEQQVPHRPLGPVRNDKVVEIEDGPAVPVAATETEIPHFVRNDSANTNHDSTNEVISLQASAEGRKSAELRSAGQPRAALPTQASAVEQGNLVVQIPLEQIDENPYQTRNLVDEAALGELAESIKAQGVVQPVVVRPGEHGRYVLILGERRCRASKIAGKSTVPAIVRRVSDQQAAEMTIIENLQREDLNCMEQARAFQVLSQEFNLTQEQIGRRVGMSRESVSNYMRLLRLPQTVIEHLQNNQLAFSEARELMMLNDDKLIARAADITVKKHLSIEKVEDLVMEMQGLGPNRPPAQGRGARWVDPNVRAAQMDLERLLGVRVRIRDRRGKGKIVIEYATVDDYERVVEALRGKSSSQ